MQVVKVLYFASLREKLGTSQESLTLPAGASTVADLVDSLRARGGAWQEAFRPGAVWRVAVNQNMSSEASPVGSGDEVAFFPPVTGG
jgi:molybdopterin synthase sulfur carrier subunit